MLTRVNHLKGFKLASLDGEIGEVQEFYFDDKHWVIRYLVADTGDWLFGMRVLLSPYALKEVSLETRRISIALTRQQIEDSPPLGTDQAVSRLFEASYYRYYGWPTYFGGPHPWGPYPVLLRNRREDLDSVQGGQGWDPNLRSTRDVSGYHVQAKDGALGHVEDFVIDDETWTIRFLIINTSNWWQGHQVLVAPHWIESVNWAESKVYVDLTRAAIERSPAYSEGDPVTRAYEARLHDHYHGAGTRAAGTGSSKP